MTKKDLVEKIYEHFSEKIALTQKECKEIVDKIFDYLKEGLEEDGIVKINNFGIWKVKHKKERKGRNPQTGETIILPARKVVSFKVSKNLKEEIN